MSGSAAASGTGRSWTDPVTNTISLSGFDIVGYTRWLHNRRVEINEILPDFLHEFTHHWCFNSLVGGTLSLMQTRARQTAFLTECKTPEARRQTLEDLVRVRASLNLLEPLAEGLAQLAEFDVELSKTGYMSSTLVAALHCFGFSLEGKEEPALALKVLLQNVRRSLEFCERKAGRFARPVSGADPYLGGYLAVKALWPSAARRSKVMQHPDVFLGYLRSWFYDDPVLVSVLLSKRTSGIASASAISQHVRDRFNQFLSCDLGREVELWVKSAVVPKTDIVTPGIGRTREQFEQANSELEPIFYEHETEPELDDRIKAVLLFKHILATSRRYTVLGHFSAEIIPGPDGAANIRPLDDPEFNLTGIAPGLKKAQQGSVFVIWDSQPMLLAALAVTGEQVIHVKMFGEPKPEKLEEVSKFAASHDQIIALGGVLDAALDRVAQTLEFLIMRQHLDSESARIAEDLYSEMATLNATDESRPEIVRQLREAGLFALLNYDADLTRGLAAIGIANTMSQVRSNVQFILQLLQLDAERVIRGIQESQEQHGMKLIAATGDEIIALI